MGNKNDNLTHEEVWDDSALIDSWNEALEEYKKYHSIHAKGGSLKDLEALELETLKAQEAQETQDAKSNGETEPSKPPGIQASQDAAPTSHSTAAPPLQMMLGSVKDENLKKLLMSWYYAGYYTGLYEGQQQARQDSHQ